MATPADVVGRSTGGSPPRPRRRRRWVLRVALALGVLALAWVGWAAVSVLGDARADDRTPTDAIVVLGAAQYDGTPSPVLRSRLDHARDLWADGVAPEIVLTGSKLPDDRFTEAYAGFTYLLGEGVPEDDMRVVTDGRTTWESMAATKRVLDGEGVDEVTVVSDGYHNRRLAGIASELGLDARFSGSSTGVSASNLARETGLVAAGEVIGFRRLDRAN